MKFLFLSILLLISSALALPTPTGSGSALPPGLDLSQIYIAGITYGGSGCKQGTVGIKLSEDRKTFTLIFDEYIATIGPKIPIQDSRKNCQINVDMHYPGGFQYSVMNTDYRGFVELDEGVKGTQKATYYFTGDQKQTSLETNFHGPVSMDYLTHDEVDFTSVIWAPCGASRPLNINSQIRLDNSANKKGSGLLTTDAVDGKVTFVVGVQWQSCV